VLRHQPQAADAQILQQDTTPVDVEHHDDLITAPSAATLRPMPADRPRRSHNCVGSGGVRATLDLPHPHDCATLRS
jgi:hypothetical protein